MPTVVGKESWRLALLLVLVLAALPAGSQSAQAPNPKTFVVNPIVPELSWLRLDQAKALLERLHLNWSSDGKGPFVVKQDLPAGRPVKPGTVVTVTVGQPSLLLEVDNANPPGQDATFTLTLQPPIPMTRNLPSELEALAPPPQVRYLFRWSDNSDGGPVEQPVAGHHFEAGTYVVSGRALVEKYPLTSNSVQVTVAAPPSTATETGTVSETGTTTETATTTETVSAPAKKPTSTALPTYTAELYVVPSSTRIGSPVVASVSVKPAPAPGAEYRFEWGDGYWETVDAPAARHAYKSSGEKSVTATVIIDGQAVCSTSARVQVTRVPPPLLFVVLALGVLLAVITLIVKIVKRPTQTGPAPSSLLSTQTPPAPSSLVFRSGLSSVTSEIQQSDPVRMNLTVRIRGGSSPPVSSIPFDDAQKRSADA